MLFLLSLRVFFSLLAEVQGDPISALGYDDRFHSDLSVYSLVWVVHSVDQSTCHAEFPIDFRKTDFAINACITPILGLLAKRKREYFCDTFIGLTDAFAS